MHHGDRTRSVLCSTKDAALGILSWAKESTDAFPPLKSAVGCVLFIAETVDVSFKIDLHFVVTKVKLYCRHSDLTRKNGETWPYISQQRLPMLLRNCNRKRKLQAL
jgi:hypothetical protein